MDLVDKLVRQRARIAIVLGTAVILFMVALPFYMGTNTYPLAIVNGNSMYPNLQNGDLILFHSVADPDNIQNGTIVVYVNTETGVSGLDSLMKPIIIHRVIGEVSQSDGTVNYVTKGDNNLVQDPALVPSDHIIGTPLIVAPKVGLVFLFVQSPQGLVAAVGMITIMYLAKYEGDSKDEQSKKKFLAALAKMSLNGEIPEVLFRKLELAVKYLEDLKIDDLTDSRVVALVDWMKRGWPRQELESGPAGMSRMWLCGANLRKQERSSLNDMSSLPIQQRPSYEK